jgi:hypothetical protein
MKTSLGKFSLFNRLTNQFETAELFQELDQKNVDDFNQLWKPELNQLASAFSSWADRAKANAQDSHWDWGKKAAFVAGRLDYETFAVECDGITQGMMLVNLVAFSKIKPSHEVAYVDFIASAPWNRPGPSKKYDGVGPLLLGAAISLSLNSGFGGRVALHSLPQAEPWYRDTCRFTDLGDDDDKQMRYFEATEEQALAFVSNKEDK